jgi:hypothetical protein
MFGDFNAKMEGEDIFKPTIGNDSIHQANNDNCVRIVNFVILKNLMLKARCSRTEKFTTTPRLLLMDRLQTDCSHIDRISIRVHSMYGLLGELTVILITDRWLQNLGND